MLLPDGEVVALDFDGLDMNAGWFAPWNMENTSVPIYEIRLGPPSSDEEMSSDGEEMVAWRVTNGTMLSNPVLVGYISRTLINALAVENGIDLDIQE